jgi:hypothetical protein
MEQAASRTLLHDGFLLVLFFDPEDGGDIFLRNFG